MLKPTNTRAPACVSSTAVCVLTACRTLAVRPVLIAASIIVAACSGALAVVVPAVAVNDPSAVASLVQQENVSLDQAERDLQVQAQAGNIRQELEAKLGSSYAGLWFDLQHGRFHIDVTSKANQAVAEEVTSKDEITKAADFDPVTRTWLELQATQETLNSSLAPLRAHQQVLVAADPKSDSVTVLVASNTPAAGVLQADAAAAASSVRGTVLAVMPQALQVVASSCSFPYCSSPQRGGVRINSTPDESGYYHFCTAGFLVESRMPKRRAVLTAGHCFEPEGPWNHGFSWNTQSCAFGNPLGHVLNEGHDAGLILDSGCEMEPYIAAWTKNENLPIVGIEGSYYGRFLCHFGATSESQCGSVEAINVTSAIDYSKEGRGVLNILHTDVMCALGLSGDSGGPWATWTPTMGPPTEAYGSAIDLGANEKSCAEGGVSIGYELPYALEAVNASFIAY